MIQTLTINNFLIKALVFVLVSAALFIAAPTIFNSKVFAVNETGFGWAIPIRNDTESPCSASGLAPGSQRIVVILRDANTGNPVNANIRMAYGGTTTSPGTQTNVNQAEIDCVRVDRGVHVGVWNAPGYRVWDQATSANQGGLGTRQFNWCCGFISLNPSTDRGKTVYYNIYLVPSSGQATITAVNPTGTTAPGEVINSAGATTPVDFQVRIGSALPQCGGGSQSINVYLRVINTATGAIVISSDEGSFFSNFPFGSTQTFTKNLPNGTYTWYAQYHETPRRCGFISDSIPITSQFPINYFTIQPPAGFPTADIKANGSDGPITIAYNTAATISWTSTNADECLVTPGGWTDLNHTGRSSGNLTGSRTYQLECSNAVGTATDTVRINVPRPLTSGRLVTFIFNDLDGDGVQDTVAGPNFEPVIQFTDGLFIVRSGSESGPELSPIGSQYSYSDHFPAGSQTIFVNIPSGWAPTRFGNTEAGGATYTTGAYVGACCGYLRTTPVPIATDQITRLGLGVRAAVVGSPNLRVGGVFVRPPGTLTAGTIMGFGGNVGNTGLVNTSPSVTRARIDLDDNGTFDVTLTPDQPTGTIIPGGLETERWLNSWTALVGTHRVEVCADVTNTNAESDETDNCATRTFTVGADIGYLKTERGDVGSKGEIQDLDKSSGDTSADYLVISGLGTVLDPTVLNTVKDWLVDDYDLTLPDTNRAFGTNSFFGKYGQGAGALAPNNIPVGQGVYGHTGNFDWSNNYTGSCTANSQESALIFIEGNLTITGPIIQKNTNCTVVIFVSGTITIDPAVTRVDAILVSDKEFNSGHNPLLPVDLALLVNGGVYSSLDGIAGRPTFVREVPGSAAERIVFKPEILWSLAPRLGKSSTQYREINP